ncbi:MAG: PmoA family protein [Caldilineaceae bacterium]|nr:PmoA family protein [Caldilineaceae bacterium]
MLSFDVAAAAGLASMEEALLSADVGLEWLGVEPAQIEQRQVGFWVQERLADGQTVRVPAQAELLPNPGGRVMLTWLAPRSASASRRVRLELAERGNGKALPFPAVQVLPDAIDRVLVSHDSRDLLGYCYSGQYRKPFFYPVNGPSGRSVTRLGHPRDFGGGHDHHRSLWIEHENVNDVCFETEHLHFFAGTDSPLVGIGRIEHDRFLRQEDGPVYARLEMALAWVSHEGEVLLNEIRRVRVCPLAGGEQLIDFDLTFAPRVEQVTFGQSTFGILAARVAHSLESGRGGGRIVNARGALNEEEVHLRRAEWCDYAGPISPTETNGIAILGHPENLHYPHTWHVRDDGWMCAAPFGRHAKTIHSGETLNFRFRVFVHGGDDAARVAARHAEFAQPTAVSVSEGEGG